MLKALIEKRNGLVDKIEGVLTKAKTETRAFTEEETGEIEAAKKEIRAIDATIKEMDEFKGLEKRDIKQPDGEEEKRAADEANFAMYIREKRGLDAGTNGGIIPVSIAGRIIEKVKELSPIYSLATIYNVGGDLVLPYYDETTSSIGAAYSDEFTELTEGTGKFTTIKLQSFIVGCLAKISNSLINKTDFDLVSYVITKVATAIAQFLEKELIVGTSGKMQGISSTTNTITSATVNTVGLDDLIDLQMAVPEVYQANACWIMNKATLKTLRKIKDGNGDYVLTRDLIGAFGWQLLGKRVYISENCPTVATGNKAAFYGDMSGLAVKITKNVQVSTLVEKYATQYAVGVVGYIEVDSKVAEAQKIAALIVK